MELFAGIKDYVSKLPFKSETGRRSFMNGLDGSMEGGKSIAVRFWKYEYDVLNEIEKALLLLYNNPDSWVKENNQIAFHNQEILDKYNAYIINVRDIQKKQIALENERVSAIEKNLR